MPSPGSLLGHGHCYLYRGSSYKVLLTSQKKVSTVQTFLIPVEEHLCYTIQNGVHCQQFLQETIAHVVPIDEASLLNGA